MRNPGFPRGILRLSNRFMRNGFVYLVIGVAVLAVIYMIFTQGAGEQKISYTQLLTAAVQDARSGRTPELVISGNRVVLKSGNTARYAIMNDRTDINSDLNARGLNVGDREDVRVTFEESGRLGFLVQFLTSMFPVLLFIGILIFMMRQAQGSNNQALSFGKSKARMISGHRPTVTFQGRAGSRRGQARASRGRGVSEISGEVHQDRRAHSQRRAAGGAAGDRQDLPRQGRGGRGRRAVLQSQRIGIRRDVRRRGASRVRDLFDKARNNAPCLIFVDEIDAVGRQRGAGLGGSHDEREQTLNQILVEMDGFESDTKVIVLAATNRPDILDPALLRPGRFDRQVILDRPDIRGREAILKVHSRSKPLEADVDLLTLAKQTSGFTGADLENLLNEGSILAARENKSKIAMVHLEESIDRVMAGPERKSRVISDKEKLVTAIHETGHALVGHLLGEMDPVHKLSIIARGRMGGYTRFLPVEDRSMMSRTQYMDQLATMMGGRAAEMLVFNEITTGAANDLTQATTLSRQMVTQYGMSAKLGPRTFGKVNELVFLGRDIAETRDYSESVAEQIDAEVTGLVSEAHQRATDILRQNEEALRRVADNLTRLETIGVEDFKALYEGRELPVPVKAEEPAKAEPQVEPPAPESPAAPPAGRLAEEPGSAA